MGAAKGYVQFFGICLAALLVIVLAANYVTAQQEHDARCDSYKAVGSVESRMRYAAEC